MRVLLPLRKVAANKQASNSSLSDLEDEGYREAELEDIPSADSENDNRFIAASFPQDHQALPSASAVASHHQHQELEGQAFGVAQEKASIGAAPQTAGLKQAASVDRGRAFSPVGKRKAAGGDLKVSKKRPALDRKPPARDLGTMGAPGRTRLHRSNADQRDTASLVTANPLYGNRSTSEDEDFDFAVALQKSGLEIREQDGDGNCLFRAISLQVYGDPSMHTDVRKKCLDFMVRRNKSNACEPKISCILPLELKDFLLYVGTRQGALFTVCHWGTL